jgi:hypothetical protein
MAPKVFGLMKMNLKMPEARNSSCNIGGPEVRRRKIAGIISAVFTIIVAISLIVLDASLVMRSVIFIPVLMTAIGWYQTRRRFCLAYGFAGVFNLGDLGRGQTVMDPAQRRRDRIQVFKTIGEAVLISSLVTILLVYV